MSTINPLVAKAQELFNVSRVSTNTEVLQLYESHPSLALGFFGIKGTGSGQGPLKVSFSNYQGQFQARLSFDGSPEFAYVETEGPIGSWDALEALLRDGRVHWQRPSPKARKGS